jgi:hypothetical protein
MTQFLREMNGTLTIVEYLIRHSSAHVENHRELRLAWRIEIVDRISVEFQHWLANRSALIPVVCSAQRDREAAHRARPVPPLSL